MPGPNILPDGGSTPDGGAASGVEQLRTALQWFGSHVRSCKKTAPKGAERDYDRVTLTFEDLNSPPNFRLVFALRSGAVDDLYTFDLKFSAYTELTIEATDDRTEYSYSDGFGYSYRVSLTVQNGYMSVRATDLTLGVELACTTVP